MVSDAEMLDACPDFISVGSLLKATPATEGADRIVYFEASNEGLDQQGEVVAAKALSESASYFLRYGNIDIDHYTQIGAKKGIPKYEMYEIGRPLDVGQRGGKTFVKSLLYSGSGEAAQKANEVWSSLTECNPPHRWYPSVGGAVLQKAIEIDGKTMMRKSVIARVRWSNIGISKQPVNQHVPECATVPIGVFAKSFNASGMIDLTKALTAGYGTDSAGLVGGAALREQSLDRGIKNYWDFREQAAGALRHGLVGKGSSKEIAAYAEQQFGLSPDEAAGYVERFMRDLQSGLQQRKAS